MREGWTRTRFIDAVEFREGPGILAKDFRAFGVPLIRLAGLERGASLLSGCNHLCPRMVAEKWSHFALEVGDVLLSTSGSLGRIAIVEGVGAGGIPYTGIIRLRPKSNLIERGFLRYTLEGPDFQRQAEMLGVGSVIRHFGPTHLREMALTLPPLPEQRAIASVLGALDDKIDLNRRMCQTLEEMARALFKSWFVDFDPVRAKMEGRDPGLPKEIADLFPSRLVDSELGPIPEGWSAKPLDEVADFLNGLALQKYPPQAGSATLPVLKIAQLKRGDTSGADRCSAEVPAPYRVVDGDLIFSWSGSLEVALWTGGAAALNQHLFKVNSDRFPRWCVYQWVCQHLPEFRQIAADKATTMGHIQRRHLSAARVAVPPDAVRTSADSILGPMTDRLLAARSESRNLAALRDTLLPKLISGELRVPASLGSMQESST